MLISINKKYICFDCGVACVFPDAVSAQHMISGVYICITNRYIHIYIYIYIVLCVVSGYCDNISYAIVFWYILEGNPRLKLSK